MSRSTLQCKTCRQPVAVRHHSGRIVVMAGVRVTILAGGAVELRCECGGRRVVEAERAAA